MSLGCHRIVCVVRAASNSAATARVAECMESYDLSYERHKISVTVLAGDLETDYLGLERQEYFALASRLRGVVHCGARVSSAIPYTSLRASNVGGTRRLLALALLCEDGAKVDFVHVSTMGFLPLGHTETRAVSHAGLVAQSGYAQSKWVAEQLVRHAAAEHECRARIIRPGVICGDSRTGASNLKDATSMLLCGLVTMGVVCTDARSPIPKLFNLCTVDYVAAAIVKIASLPWEQHEAQFPGAAFHLCARESISLDVLCEWLHAAGYGLSEVSALTFCARIAKAGEEHPLFAMKALFSQPAAPISAATSAQQAARFSTELADAALLAPTALPVRAMTADVLARAVANVLGRSGRADLVVARAGGAGARP